MQEKQVSQHEQEFLEWKTHPVTKDFFQWLERRREEIKESWASGEFVSSHDRGDVYQNASALATCSVLDSMKNVEYLQVYGDSE